MSNRIRYAYLKQQTWLFRRNYRADVPLVLRTSALKQSLKTSDAKVARARAAEVTGALRASQSTLRTLRSLDHGWGALSGAFIEDPRAKGLCSLTTRENWLGW